MKEINVNSFIKAFLLYNSPSLSVVTHYGSAQCRREDSLDRYLVSFVCQSKLVISM